MSQKGRDNGWDRANFNVRLTKARRDQLKAVAASLGSSATPVDALDAALRIALQPSNEGVGSERFDELEDHITAHAMKNEIEFGHVGDRIDAVRQSMDDLRALISALAESDGDSQPSEAQQAPMAFRPWIAGELAARGIRTAREAVVRVTWRATTAKSARIVAMDFDAALISVDGKSARVAAANFAGIRCEVDMASDFAAAWRQGPMVLRCSAQANGWKLHAHQAASDSSPGRAIAVLDA